ncbi:MAG: FecR domain-containing protein [Ferruginibacter sp.]|nr:FecR domain-containing protein [Ferruginibacter sp.]
MSNFSNITLLFQKYLANECSPEEVDELISILEEPGHDEITGELLRQEISKELLSEPAVDPALKARLAKRLQEILLSSRLPADEYASTPTYETNTGAKVSTIWRRWSVAASIIFIIAIGGFYYLSNKFSKQVGTAQIGQAKDVTAPKGTKAVIILADGSRIVLDSLQTGALVTQGNVQVRKNADGKIVYSGKTAEVAYNTIYNPRGSNVVALTLIDGTQVWLNAESSMKYPVAFTGTQRKVEITGEAYFEVSKDAKKKFLVDAKGVITEVLGTHFNVNSYSDEASTKITLLEGSVKVTSGTATGLLKPRQQAQCSNSLLGNGGGDGGIKILNDIDTDEVMAWKEGKFQFGEKADIASIMRQIARWYNVEVEFKGTVTEHIGGSISRNVNASKVLKMLGTTGVAKFVIEGNKVIVSPQ